MIKNYVYPLLALQKFNLKKSDVRYARVYLLHMFSLFTILVFSLSVLLGFFLQMPAAVFISNGISLFLSIMIYSTLHYKKNKSLAANLLITLVLFSTLFNLVMDNNEHLSLIGTLIFPIIAIFFKGLKTGFILSVLHMMVVLPFAFWGITNFTPSFSLEAFIYYLFVSGVIMFLVSFYESSRNATQKALQEAHKELDSYKNDLEKKVMLAIEDAKSNELMLIQQSKMAQTGDMLASISHQWKQPLSTLSATITNIKLNVELHTLDDKELRDSLQSMTQQVDYMNQTIRDFTNFFKPSNAKEHFNVKQCLQEILPIINPELSRHEIVLDISIENERLTIFGSKNEFLQVLLNIINNATDAIAEMKVEGMIHIKVEEKDTTVEISIEDNAGGVSSDIIETIFQPYVTSKADTKGTGIGLHMVKTIVENHMNGHIDVSNSLRGACFTLHLNKS